MPQSSRPATGWTPMAAALTALGSPVRLSILSQLRSPKSLGEVRVRPARGGRGGQPGRAIARQTVQGHIDRLVEAGLVRVVDGHRRGRAVPIYQADLGRLFALTEQMRGVSTLYAGLGPVGDATGTVGEAPAAPVVVRGPALIMVRGVYEAKRFALANGGAIIGRGIDCDVRIDYDAAVSGRHARLDRRRGSWRLTDLESKNGTTLNWESMVPGSTVPLSAGDLIGLGRSLLVLRLD